MIGLISLCVISLCVADDITEKSNVDLKSGISMRQDESNVIANFRQAGLSKDHSQIDQMVEIIRTWKPTERSYVYTTMHSLAQLGADKSLPLINIYAEKSVMEPGYDPDLSNFSIAARARLIAESSTLNIVDSKARAFAKIRRFYQELNLTPNGLNSSLVVYNSRPRGSMSGNSPHPVGVYAVRELADMVYQGSYTDYSSLPQVTGIDFNSDYPSALKIRLAPLTKSERLSTLIQELSHRTVGINERNYDLQLAINEGTSASNAAAAELKIMDNHRIQYNQVTHHSGFVSMFYIIAGVGDQSQIPIIEHYLTDQDHWVRHYAEIADRSLSKGIKRETAPAY